jgi:hypothetical protein
MGFSSARRYFSLMNADTGFRLSFAAIIIVAAAIPLSAQRGGATQTVGFRVEAISEIAVQGSPNLTLISAAAGSGPASVVASGSTWSVTTNESNTRVTASLTEDMPTGVTLSLKLGAPAGAVSRGFQPLGTTPIDVVTNVSRVAAAGLSLVYQLDATPRAGIVVEGTRTVVFTITAGM